LSHRFTAENRFGRAGSAALKLCAAAMLLAIMMLMVVDVTMRYVFNHPVPGAGEVIELAMGVLVFSALPLTTLRREHVTLDYFEHIFPEGGRQIVRALADLATAAIIGFLAWRLAVKSTTYLRYGDTTPYLNWPIAPVAMFVAAMAAVTAILLALSVLSRSNHGGAPE